ncbi:hypothetical protein [Streptomyces sp. NPDC004528]|uniref:hypothetical protein n=1 Tax=Streptomyces sp. NPDC004528 TaxID=3154550 RepID=UPI0033B76164
MIDDPSETLAQYFRRRAFTAEQYTRQGMLDALREVRRTQAHESGVKFLGQAAEVFEQDLAAVVDLPPADIATVLLAAGGAIGVMAELYGLSASHVAGVLHYAADDFDRQAEAGEQS